MLSTFCKLVNYPLLAGAVK